MFLRFIGMMLATVGSWFAAQGPSPAADQIVPTAARTDGAALRRPSASELPPTMDEMRLASMARSLPGEVHSAQRELLELQSGIRQLKAVGAQRRAFADGCVCVALVKKGVPLSVASTSLPGKVTLIRVL